MKRRLRRLRAIPAFVSCILGSLQTLAQNDDGFGNVPVIDGATNTVTATIPVGAAPLAVAVSSDGGTVYVANAKFLSNNVSAIATATNKVIAALTVGSGPVAFGVFIIRSSFAGTKGFSNCQGVSALAGRLGGLNAPLRQGEKRSIHEAVGGWALTEEDIREIDQMTA